MKPSSKWFSQATATLLTLVLLTAIPFEALAQDLTRQSPIDLTGAKAVSSAAPKITYQNTPLKVKNIGHTVQVYCDPGNSITAEGTTWSLAQFHFHTPSEHKLNGVAYDMEVHLVHTAGKKNLVLGVFLKQAKSPNALIQRIWDLAGEEEDATVKSEGSFNPQGLLPRGDTKLFRYDGSLTTNPFSETVTWYVCATPIEVSQAQINAFKRKLHSEVKTSARPIQPLNSRTISVSGPFQLGLK